MGSIERIGFSRFWRIASFVDVCPIKDIQRRHSFCHLVVLVCSNFLKDLLYKGSTPWQFYVYINCYQKLKDKGCFLFYRHVYYSWNMFQQGGHLQNNYVCVSRGEKTGTEDRQVEFGSRECGKIQHLHTYFLKKKTVKNIILFQNKPQCKQKPGKRGF